MITVGNGSLSDVAFAVCTAMFRSGVTVVLSGGGAAAYYAPNAYSTRDLDFILQFSPSPPSAKPILDIGFRQSKTSGIYQHSEVSLTVEFLEGPLAVGDELISNWATIEKEDLVLNVISPTDSVRDRLAAGIHW